MQQVAPRSRPTDLHRTRDVGRPGGVPGLTLCRNDHPAPRHAKHNAIPGSLGERLEIDFSRLRWRPPFAQSAWSTPFPSPPNDHADWATLGRQGRPRRPEMKESSVRGSGRGSDSGSGSRSAPAAPASGEPASGARPGRRSPEADPDAALTHDHSWLFLKTLVAAVASDVKGKTCRRGGDPLTSDATAAGGSP